jgi:hypothetical protein
MSLIKFSITDPRQTCNKDQQFILAGCPRTSSGPGDSAEHLIINARSGFFLTATGEKFVSVIKPKTFANIRCSGQYSRFKPAEVSL